MQAMLQKVTKCQEMASFAHTKPHQAALLMASGMPITAIAADLGVSRMTIYRWKRKKAFRKTLDNASGQIQNEFERQLKTKLAEFYGLETTGE
jgi:transposase